MTRLLRCTLPAFLALTLAGCVAGEPVAPKPSDRVWKTLHPEQWDIDPATVAVPAMPKGAG